MCRDTLRRTLSKHAHILVGLAGNVSVDLQPMPGMPDRIRLVSPDIELLDYAGQDLGLHVQPSAPTTLLAAIPPVDDTRSWFPSEPPSTSGVGDPSVLDHKSSLEGSRPPTRS